MGLQTEREGGVINKENRQSVSSVFSRKSLWHWRSLQTHNVTVIYWKQMKRIFSYQTSQRITSVPSERNHNFFELASSNRIFEVY